MAKRQTSDNPVFYVQYAHARIAACFAGRRRRASAEPRAAQVTSAPLKLEEEVDILKHLHLFPEVVEAAALQHEPHRVAFYLQELAAKFHPYYNKHRFLTEDAELTRARLGLIAGIRTVIRNGLGLLGVSSPETM